jgi:hypothetical protein
MACSCCGATEGIEQHHLYLRSEGCPDDLTVPLCYVCHGRAHGLKRRINISERTKAALAEAKARGVKLGRPVGTIVPNARLGSERGCKAVVEAADAFAARVAPIAREMQAAGRSLRQIAAELDARGIMTARGGAWTAMAVHNLLARIKVQ